MVTLKITEQLMDHISTAAKASGSNECMGLLASKRDSEAVTTAYLLPAVASAAHAEATPLAIKQCAEGLLIRGLIPRGLWHSHGHLGVFHSSTDHTTIHRLLPAMASWNFERPRPLLLAPTITTPSTAILPRLDSQTLTFFLLRSPIPELEANEQAEWNSIEIRFAEARQEPRAILEADHLRLEGGGAVITLGIPEGASVSCRKEDSAPFRIARVFSLVVNNKGETCAECLVVYEIAGHCLTQQLPCDIEVVQDLSRSEEMNGSFMLRGEEISRPNTQEKLRGLLARFRH